MLLIAMIVLGYYSVWVLALVSSNTTRMSTQKQAACEFDRAELTAWWSVWLVITLDLIAPLVMLPCAVQPFLSPSHPLQSLFLPRAYAVGIPVGLLVVGVSGIGAFLASVLIKSGKKKST